MGVRLPAAYQEVEYVQATGTQAFFTDVPIQDGLTVDSVQTFARGDNYLFGGNNGNVQICFNGTYNGRLQSSYNGFYYWTGGFDVQDNNTTKYHVVQTQRNGSQIGFLDDVQILNGTRSTTKDTSAGKTAALFGQRNASGVLSTFYKGKLYSCKVSKDDTLLADFVPCYRKADGEIGMYDLVLQKFYVNEGTGVFLKGNDVIGSISPLMVAWRRMLMRKPSPIPTGYVTDGLLLWLDAKCNTRQGFNPAPEYWEDLSGNERDYYLRPAAKASFVNNAIYFEPGVAHNSIETSKQFTGDEISAIRNNEGSIELVVDPNFQQQYGFIVGFGQYYPQITADNSNNNLITFDVQSQTKFSLIAQSGLHYYNSSKMIDGVVQSPVIYSTTWNNNRPSSLFAYGSSDTQYCYIGRCSVLRIYNRKLTDAELMQNWLRDKARYNL